MSWSPRIQYETGAQVSNLHQGWLPKFENANTSGLDVVWLQKVEPVGLMLGGYLDL